MTRRLLAIAALALGAALPLAAQTGWSVRSDGTGSNADVLFRIDLASGVATPFGATGFGDVESLAFAPGCQVLFGVDDVTDRLLTCSLTTGACSAVGPLGVDVTDTGLAFGPDGRLYMSIDAPNPRNLYRLNPSTGLAVPVGNQGQEVTGLAGNRTALFGLGGDGRNNLVRLNLVNGAAAVVGPLGAAVSLQDGGLDFDAAGVLYGITDVTGRTGPSQVFRVNTATGAATVVTNVTSGGSPINGFEGLAIADGICTVLGPQSVTQIPTLSEWGMAILALALAAGGLALLRRG